jgi:CspA family cold shock protein
MSSSDTSASVRLTGRVKWFNNKTGFGFITIVGGNDQFKDASEIFAHHSAIKVSQEQYRYLVEGEYVEFSVSTTESGDHKFQAADVRGVKGGKLFCETRHEQRVSAPATAPSYGLGDRSARGAREISGERTYSGDRAVRGGGGGGGGSRLSGPSRGRGGRGEWMLVRKDAPEFRGSGRGGGRVFSSHPNGHRQPRESSLMESFVEHSQPQATQASAPSPTSASAPAPAQAPASTPSASASGPNEVPATPRAASARKPKQSKPLS